MDGLITVATIIGYVMVSVSGIWILLSAFTESIWCGLFYIFVPFYALYYVFSRWYSTKWPFFIGLIGAGLLLASAVAIVPG